MRGEERVARLVPESSRERQGGCGLEIFDWRIRGSGSARHQKAVAVGSSCLAARYLTGGGGEGVCLGFRGALVILKLNERLAHPFLHPAHGCAPVCGDAGNPVLGCLPQRPKTDKRHCERQLCCPRLATNVQQGVYSHSGSANARTDTCVCGDRTEPHPKQTDNFLPNERKYVGSRSENY